MRLPSLVLGLLALLALDACHPPAPKPVRKGPLVFFHQVRVFDGEKTTLGDVLVDGKHVAEVGPSLEVPAGAEVIEGEGKTLLPAFVDAHVHAGKEDEHLQQNLVFGVGLVVDMFGPPTQIKARHAAEAALVPDALADLRGAATLATAPNGHGTEFGIPIPTLVSPEEAPAFVDGRVAEGADFVKIVFEEDMPTISRQTMRALIDAAHARGKLALIHVGKQHEARAAIEEGADGLAHLFYDSAPSADLGPLVASKKAFVIPTLTVLARHCGVRPGIAIAEDPQLSPYLLPGAGKRLRKSYKGEDGNCIHHAFAAVAAMKAAKVPILAGTDAANAGTAHGASLHGELSLLVEAGLTPTEALTAATATPARVFSLAGRGHIAPGMRADLVLVAGDPTKDIKATRAIVTIWKLGARVPRPRLAGT